MTSVVKVVRKLPPTHMSLMKLIASLLILPYASVLIFVWLFLIDLKVVSWFGKEGMVKEMKLINFYFLNCCNPHIFCYGFLVVSWHFVSASYTKM
jgi:hypothetical protein